MGRSIASPVRWNQPDEVKSTRPRRIKALVAEVMPDGGAVSFIVQYESESPFRVFVSHNEMPVLLNEIRAAAIEMARRQALSYDAGASAIVELCRQALRPSHIGAMVDRQNGDRIFHLQFADYSPMALAITAEQAASLRKHMDKLAKELSN